MHTFFFVGPLRGFIRLVRVTLVEVKIEEAKLNACMQLLMSAVARAKNANASELAFNPNRKFKGRTILPLAFL